MTDSIRKYPGHPADILMSEDESGIYIPSGECPVIPTKNPEQRYSVSCPVNDTGDMIPYPVHHFFRKETGDIDDVSRTSG